MTAAGGSEELCRDVQWAVDRNGTKTQYDHPLPGPAGFWSATLVVVQKIPLWLCMCFIQLMSFGSFSPCEERYSLLRQGLGSCGAIENCRCKLVVYVGMGSA